MTQIGKHPRKPWKSFVTAANKAVAKDDAIDLLDQLLRYDHQEVDWLFVFFRWCFFTSFAETDGKRGHETLVLCRLELKEKSFSPCFGVFPCLKRVSFCFFAWRRWRATARRARRWKRRRAATCCRPKSSAPIRQKSLRAPNSSKTTRAS
jgi:hypothetical protein